MRMQTTPPPTAAPLDAELDSPGIIGFFNDFRSAIAKGVFADGSPTNLAQSDGLFKIVDDPTLAKYAAAEAGDAVDVRLPAEYSRAVYSTQLTYASDITFVRKALDVWYRYTIGVLPADSAVYLQRDVATLDGYAQAVYYKSVRGSCVIRRNIFSTPSGKKGTILACVFNSRPVVGQTLYPVKRSPTQGKGCTIDCSCQYYSGSNGSKCDTASGLCIAGTGSTFPSHTTPSTGTSTTRTTPSTTRTTTTPSTTTTTTTRSTTKTTTTPSTTTTRTTPSTTTTTTTPSTTTTTTTRRTTKTTTTRRTTTTTTTRRTTPATTRPTTTPPPKPVTNEIASKIVDRHNHYRSMVARGIVRDGKPGNKNCPTATNMNKLSYDWNEGVHAQRYADSCPTSQAATCNNLSFGQNVYIVESNTIPFGNAFESAVDTWFNEISKHGINYQMLFTETMMTKKNGPRRFTQLAWGVTRRIGCGAQRCGHRTVVVCRYQPAGNILGQYVYNKGNTCASCKHSCQNSLCP
ncbi:hypothetical protein Q1695_008240 [Nippostrongylus brasiliensis]|nr:hypothetical protein Q1695_008240 [Nippostrongylus brasiliensis]